MTQILGCCPSPLFLCPGAMADGVLKTDLTTLERFDQLEDARRTWVDEWQDIARYVFPRRSIFEDSKGEAKPVGQHIYDGTALGANKLLANGLMGYFVSSSYPWFRLLLPWEDANELPGVRAWLEHCEKIIYDDFHRSNFYEETVEVFQDAGAIGTAVMYVDEDDTEMPFFRAIHPKEFYIDTDQYGRINTVYRRFFPSVRDLRDWFGADNLSNSVQKQIQNGTLAAKVEVIHACEPRHDRDATNPSSGNKKWMSEYWERVEEHKIHEGGYDRFPYVGLRWSTNSDESYGRGPGNDALVDIKRANQMGKDLLDIAHRAADPPLNVPEEMRNRVKNVPGGHNYFSSPDMLIQPFQSNGQYPIALDRENYVRERIEDHFLVDFFLMLQRAPQKMTATEVMERQAEKAAVLGTIIGRIASDFLDPVIDLVFWKAGRNGRLPSPPLNLLQWMQAHRISRGQMKVEYIGPLAQAQKKFHVTQGVLQGLNSTLPYAQFKPEILDLIDWDETIRAIAEAQGMPAHLILDKKQVQAIREARLQAQQKAAEMQQQMAGADAYQKLTKAPESGSPVESIGDMIRRPIAATQGAA